MATREANGRAARAAWGAALLLLCAAGCGGGERNAAGNAPATAAAVPAGGGTASEGPGATGGPLEPMPVHASGMTGGGLPPGHPAVPETDSTGGLRWTAPKEWVETTPSSPMRRAQYRLPAAGRDRDDGECVVYYFGAGQGGDAQANIQRWVAQFSGPGSEAPHTSEVKAGGLTVSRVEVGGTYTPSPMSMGGGPEPQPKPGYILIGAIVPGPDANWFFKCTGPEKTMKDNRGRFDALIGSIQVAR